MTTFGLALIMVALYTDVVEVRVERLKTKGLLSTVTLFWPGKSHNPRMWPVFVRWTWITGEWRRKNHSVILIVSFYTWVRKNYLIAVWCSMAIPKILKYKFFSFFWGGGKHFFTWIFQFLSIILETQVFYFFKTVYCCCWKHESHHLLWNRMFFPKKDMALLTANEKRFHEYGIGSVKLGRQSGILVTCKCHGSWLYTFTWSVTAQYVFSEFYNPKAHETCSHINCHN